MQDSRVVCRTRWPSRGSASSITPDALRMCLLGQTCIHEQYIIKELGGFLILLLLAAVRGAKICSERDHRASEDTMIDPVRYLLSALTLSCIRELKEQVSGAVDDASRFANRMYPGPAESQARGQLRHHSLEKALEGTAEACGLPSSVQQTSPSGGNYTMIVINLLYLRLLLGRGNVQRFDNSMPRKTKFRKELALLNAWMCPVQLDLFRKVKDPPKGEIYALLLVSVDPLRPEKVKWAGIGIPTPDLSGWIALASLDELILLGASLEPKRQRRRRPTAKIEDEAMPKLKF